MKRVPSHKSASAVKENQGRTGFKYARLNSAEDSNYVLLHNSVENGNNDEIDLHTFRKKKEQYLEKVLQPGDTLLSLSLEFNCPGTLKPTSVQTPQPQPLLSQDVSWEPPPLSPGPLREEVAELKRVNKIHKENEVYALRVVKIPLRYYSLLSERLATVHTAGNGNKENTESNEASTNTFSSINKYERNTETSKNISKDSSNLVIAQVVGSSKSYIKENFKRHSTDESVIANSLTLLDNGLEECPFLPEEVLNHITVTKTSTFLSCSGADWGLSWLQLLICALAIGFLGPLLYVFYIAEDSKKHPT
uniref:Uncharacterized protein n=1 Tax=Timema cristinae TaxID=61476 RepID=A0A7R9D1U7_TIMCR|nr:unnamed protein product [Timema cristinae]